MCTCSDAPSPTGLEAPYRTGSGAAGQGAFPVPTRRPGRVREVSPELRVGEHVAVTGPNGSGRRRLGWRILAGREPTLGHRGASRRGGTGQAGWHGGCPGYPGKPGPGTELSMMRRGGCRQVPMSMSAGCCAKSASRISLNATPEPVWRSRSAWRWLRRWPGSRRCSLPTRSPRWLTSRAAMPWSGVLSGLDVNDTVLPWCTSPTTTTRPLPRDRTINLSYFTGQHRHGRGRGAPMLSVTTVHRSEVPALELVGEGTYTGARTSPGPRPRCATSASWWSRETGY